MMPYGIFSSEGKGPRMGAAHGNRVLDLSAVAALGLLDIDPSVFSADKLNPFIRLGKPTTTAVGRQLRAWLSDADGPLNGKPELFYPREAVKMHLPLEIGDYTDFYSSIEHATNVGKLFRDPENALLPNWRHLPVGYHGRASSIVVSGTPIRRPRGQTLPKGASEPVFGPSRRLDFELEMAFVIGKDSRLGEPVSTAAAEDYIFGLALFNDWSARDVQKWEYVPLGPFLGKNFASSVSPWIVPLEALEPFRVPGPDQDPDVLPYLQFTGARNYDIELEVGLQPADGAETLVSRSNYKFMYWNMVQQLAHHTSNGCNLRVGDLLASGTISGKDASSYGSLLEISEGGRKPFTLTDGSTRTFLEDGDTVTLRGWVGTGRERIDFGTVSGKILPAHP